MEDLAAVHVNEAVGHAFEHLNELRQRHGRAGVERFAVDVLDEQMHLANAEQPVLELFQGVDLDEVLVIEHLPRRGTRDAPVRETFDRPCR